MTGIGISEAGDDRCIGAAIERSYFHSQLYFLDAVKRLEYFCQKPVPN